MLQRYDHIIGIFISSLLSGTYNTAITASTLIDEPQKITIIDSQGGTLAMAMMAIEIAKKAKEGDVDETIKFAENIVRKGEIYFIPSDMKYLKRSGRVSTTQSLIIGLLNVKLILRTYEGKLVLFKKVIGAKKAMSMLYSIIRSKNILNKTVGLSVTGDFEQTEEIVSEIKKMGLNVIVGKMGNVLTTHGGPNFFAISFLTE
jgi:DegV family protein with EDD domain